VEDQRIVELYWQRDTSAIDHTQRKYGAYLTKVALNILGDLEDSMESVNDTYLAAWNAMPPHKPAALCAFLSKLTRRIAIDLLRKKQSAKRGGGEYELSLSELDQCISGGNSTEQQADANALKECITDFLRTQPEKARHAFLCRYFYMDSLKDTARYCGITESNAKVLLHRTRLALRAHLEREGYL
jgi:RNA polymerase sigma-70 factor (ECF subfamily)